MLLNYLTSKYHRDIQDGWGALEIGNIEKAEHHFKHVLDQEDDPHMGVLDLVDAHNGQGACFLAHKDFFHATRWYREAKYLLDQHFKHAWPEELHWNSQEDRPVMRALIGLGHLAYHKGNTKYAKKCYSELLKKDPKDELGVKRYLHALEKGKEFPV